jgi:hypothetical protein
LTSKKRWQDPGQRRPGWPVLGKSLSINELGCRWPAARRIGSVTFCAKRGHRGCEGPGMMRCSTFLRTLAGTWAPSCPPPVLAARECPPSGSTSGASSQRPR